MPIGPAGTGKTETIKYLGNLLGQLVLVVNCDDTFESFTVKRLLNGIKIN